MPPYSEQSSGVPERDCSKMAEFHCQAPILWPSHEKRRLPGKDTDAGKV